MAPTPATEVLLVLYPLSLNMEAEVQAGLLD
jgi:hypothetical protein